MIKFNGKVTISLYKLVLIASLISSNSFGQCNVKYFTGNRVPTIYANQEELFKNEDLENGIFVLYGFISISTDESSSVFLLNIVQGYSAYKQPIIPRHLEVSLSSRVLRLSSSTITDTEFLNGDAKRFVVNFELNNSAFNALREQSIRSMRIIDNRTNNQLTFYPYGGIFKEQINCIIRRLERDSGEKFTLGVDNSRQSSNSRKEPTSKTYSAQGTPTRQFKSNFSGTVEVFTCTAILSKPDLQSEIIERACSGKVKIVSKYNDRFYRVSYEKITGYIDVYNIKE